jgi:hypothetical protein
MLRNEFFSHPPHKRRGRSGSNRCARDEVLTP